MKSMLIHPINQTRMFLVKRTPMKMKKKKQTNTKHRENMQTLTVNAANHLLRTSNYQKCKKKQLLVNNSI